MSVRAKFRVDEITKYPVSEYPETTGQVKLSAVTGGPDESDEDNSFWKYTPAGDITMHIDNQAALDQFNVDQEFYVDFTPCQ